MHNTIVALESVEAQLSAVKKALSEIDTKSAGPLLNRVKNIGETIAGCEEVLREKKKDVFTPLYQALLETGVSHGIRQLVGVTHRGEDYELRLRNLEFFIEIEGKHYREDVRARHDGDPPPITLPGNSWLFYQFCKMGIKALEHFVEHSAPKSTSWLNSQIRILEEVLGQIASLKKLLRQKAG